MTKSLHSSLIRIFGQSGTIVGTGFLVSPCYALTCAHVVADALSLPHNSPMPCDEPIELDFPFVHEGQRLLARVTGWQEMRSIDQQPYGNEDIALLQILDAVPPNCGVAPMASTEAISGTNFQTYGFSTEKGQPAEGRVKSSIVGGCVVIEDPQGKGYFVAEGFSGAPVWNDGGVIGMVVRRDYTVERTAYMVPVGQLRKTIQSATSAKGESAVLLCHVEPQPAPPASFHMHAWLWRGRRVERVTDTHQIGKKWHEVVEEVQLLATAAHSDSADLTLELVLPRSDFNHDLTNLEMHTGGAILLRLALVLRCHKRFAARRKQMVAAKKQMSRLQFLKQELEQNRNQRLTLFDHWERNSAQLRQNTLIIASRKLFALAADHSPDHLDQELCFKQKGLFVACGFTPDSADESAAFCVALDYGVPLVVWFRELPNSKKLDEEELRTTLQLNDNVTLGDLPRHLWELRRTALINGESENPLYHLTVLYDDYQRVPL